MADPITIALATVGWVAPNVLKELGARLISYLGTDIAKEIEDLETILLPQFKLTIDAAKQSPHKDWVNKWTKRLEKAYSDVHKILREYERLRSSRSSSSTSASQRLVHFPTKFTIKPLAKFIRGVKNKTSLRKMKLLKKLNKLKQVAAEAKDLRDLLAKAGNSLELTPTTHFLSDKNVVGRNGDLDDIIRFLLNEQVNSSSLRSYSVVAITGMKGAGKTTLAQYVYNDPRVESLFQSGVRIWLSLSQNLKSCEYTKQMIEFTKKGASQFQNLGILQDELEKSLPNTNILIVLDDLCYENNDRDNVRCKWQLLLEPFANRRQGTCKIVVTSRSSLFPIALHPDKQIHLSDLSPDDFKSVLKYHAIDHLRIRNPQLMNDLTNRNRIVDLIAKKIGQSPLAAKLIGNELCQNPDITFWEDYYEKVSKSFQKIVYFS